MAHTFEVNQVIFYLGHFRWFDLLDLKEVSYSEESNSHSTDADHKNDQRWTVTYVGLQILQWIQQQHLQKEKKSHKLRETLTYINTGIEWIYCITWQRILIHICKNWFVFSIPSQYLALAQLIVLSAWQKLNCEVSQLALQSFRHMYIPKHQSMADLGSKSCLFRTLFISKRVNGNKFKYYCILRIIRGVKLCRLNCVENKQEILSNGFRK